MNIYPEATSCAFLADKYTLTIAVPTYNGRSRIEHLVNSLVVEGYACNCDVEIIFADNCSVDNLSAYLCSLPFRLTLISNSINIGFQGNLVKLISRANGKYIWIIGDDDEINAPASVIVEKLSLSNTPSLFISENQYNALMLNPLLLDTLDVIPFGFISSCIQPNTELLLDAVIKYSQENSHCSPHFFARWLFYLRFGPDSLHAISKDEQHLACRFNDNSSRSKIHKLLHTIYVLLTPFISRHYSWNWYSASKVLVPGDSGKIIPSFVDKSVTGFFCKELRRDMLGTIVRWAPHLPFLFLKDFGYGAYLTRRFIFSVKLEVGYSFKKLLKRYSTA